MSSSSCLVGGKRVLRNPGRPSKNHHCKVNDAKLQMKKRKQQENEGLQAKVEAKSPQECDEIIAALETELQTLKAQYEELESENIREVQARDGYKQQCYSLMALLEAKLEERGYLWRMIRKQNRQIEVLQLNNRISASTAK